MKKKISIILISVVVFSVLVFLLIILFISSIRGYEMNLIKETLIDSHVSIMVPEKWVLIDVRKYQEKKSGYEQHLLVQGSNFGGFPQLEIYSINVGTSESMDEKINSVIQWNQKRVEETQSDHDVTFETYTDFLEGRLIIYSISSKKTTLYQEIICKDWAFVEENTGYLISVCEFENKWSKLDKIYAEIIDSFEVME